MSDIVQELRTGRGLTETNNRRDAWAHQTMQIAADEIERLRGIIEEQRLTIGALNMKLGGATTLENLRAADQPKAAPFYGFRSEKLADEQSFHADMVFTEHEQAGKVNADPTDGAT